MSQNCLLLTYRQTSHDKNDLIIVVNFLVGHLFVVNHYVFCSELNDNLVIEKTDTRLSI